MRICSQTANIHAAPSTESETTSQALFGERVKVLKVDGRWSQIELLTDGYTGFIENAHLVDDPVSSTHRVINKLTPLFDNPDIKSPVKQLAPLGSELSLHQSDNDQFLQTNHGHYVWMQHTQAINSQAGGQLIDTAQSLFLGSPYLWGGRSPLGLDCSALVQLTAMLHGWYLPRDTSDQVTWFRSSNRKTKKAQDNVPAGSAQQIEYAQRQTDDLVYWPGHVAIVLDNDSVLHATAHSLQCCIETLSQVEARAGKPDSIWRLLH